MKIYLQCSLVDHSIGRAHCVERNGWHCILCPFAFDSDVLLGRDVEEVELGGRVVSFVAWKGI
jgi:hypothetical protein